MLSRDTVLASFRRMSEILEEKGVVGEIDVIGGAAMVLAFQARQSTKDVDAIFAPAREVRDAAEQVARESGLPTAWLNDAAKSYLSAHGEFTEGDTPQYPNLRILTAVPQYLLAMKVLASRVGSPDSSGDKRDIAFLVRLLGLTSPEQVHEIVGRYYEAARVPARALYLVEEIFEEGL